MSGETAYDAVPYPTGSYSQTHPDRLATVATLLGLSPSPPGRCRVLEIGCGNGGNLIPMAFAMPESTFIGIDLAATAIAEGNRLVEQVGLRNITLRQQDLTTYAPEPEAFDYIIAHGIYAWVAPPVQDRLLALCRAALAPQGVAFVSYNALPGAHLRLMLREMMRYHIRAMPDPKEQLEQAKALLTFLKRAWPAKDDFRAALGIQAESILTRERDNLFHDELNEEYRPVYFHEFMDHAGRHGLQYLGESEFFEMNEALCPPAGMDILMKFGPDQIVQKEQYMDFLKCRTFR
jgi:SAM-dependent methyltransferase